MPDKAFKCLTKWLTILTDPTFEYAVSLSHSLDVQIFRKSILLLLFKYSTTLR